MILILNMTMIKTTIELLFIFLKDIHNLLKKELIKKMGA